LQLQLGDRRLQLGLALRPGLGALRHIDGDDARARRQPLGDAQQRAAELGADLEIGGDALADQDVGQPVDLGFHLQHVHRGQALAQMAATPSSAEM
jgi:hypothetical protein